MLNINKKAKIPLALMIMSFSGIFLFQYLTFIPEYSHAESISTEKPEKTLADIAYMQDITPDICGNTPVADDQGNNQYRLKDSRDQKTYWVAKLKDGNCWMTQNLALNLNENALIAETSDVITSWSAAINTTSALWSIYNDNTTVIRWYNPGDRYYAPSDASNDNKEHYKSGNYYNWYTITAGSKTSQQSICPKGWKVPQQSSTTQGDFSRLGISRDAFNKAPYYMVPAGYIVNNYVEKTSSDGLYWSIGGYGGTQAYVQSNTHGIIGLDYTAGTTVRCFSLGNGVINPPIPSSPALDNPTLSVTIPNIITLDVYSDSEDKKNNVVSINTNTNDISTGTFIAEVVSNNTYNISITTAENYSTSLIGYKEDNTTPNGREIETITTATTNPPSNTWGIRNCTSLLTNSCTESYRPIPAYGSTDTTAINFLTNINKGSNTHLFQIGINIGNDLPSGTYSTQIQVTASSTGSN